jgi:hypothetical protein
VIQKNKPATLPHKPAAKSPPIIDNISIQCSETPINKMANPGSRSITPRGSTQNKQPPNVQVHQRMILSLHAKREISIVIGKNGMANATDQAMPYARANIGATISIVPRVSPFSCWIIPIKNAIDNATINTKQKPTNATVDEMSILPKTSMIFSSVVGLGISGVFIGLDFPSFVNMSVARITSLSPSGQNSPLPNLSSPRRLAVTKSDSHLEGDCHLALPGRWGLCLQKLLFLKWTNCKHGFRMQDKNG